MPSTKAVVKQPAAQPAVSFPWERQEGESLQAYARFVTYRNTPAADRSIRKVGVAPSLAFKWSRLHRWVERVGEYEAWLASLADGVSTAASLAHRGKVARFADRSLDKAILAVEAINPAKLSSSAALELAAGATALARPALAIPETRSTGLTLNATGGQVGVVWGGESPAWLPSAKLNETERAEPKHNQMVNGRAKVLATAIGVQSGANALPPAENQIIDALPVNTKEKEKD